MKNNIKFLIGGLCFLFFISSSIQAQSTEIELSNKPIQISFQVHGVCNMCKTRIENAALIKGVKFADWNKEAQILTVVYKPTKVTEIVIHEAVAEVGHDTDRIKATNKVYKSLPGCCAYRDGVEVH